jgi:hypothetical protein
MDPNRGGVRVSWLLVLILVGLPAPSLLDDLAHRDLTRFLPSS